MIIGIDTSCYTTSVAVYDPGADAVLADERIMLQVAAGERGLRQSDAVFMHNRNMPELFSRLNIDYGGVTGIAVSSKPRDADGSYMPVFTAGHAFARVLAYALGCPCREYSHQRGHIAAGMWAAGMRDVREFLAWHISGGTTELLHVRGGGIDIIGKTLDISAGQLIDRAGVRMGMRFPCGAELDALSCGGDGVELPVSVKGRNINLSGLENKISGMIASGVAYADIAAGMFCCIAKSLISVVRNADLGLPLLMVGGVAANGIIRRELKRAFPHVYFAPPGLSADNAVGVAVAERYRYLETEESC